MQLIISRLSDPFQGLEVAVKIADNVSTLAVLNGNKSEYRGPIILLGLDQYTVFGLSHPSVVRRLLDNGPQTLISSRELAHTLFEHGMKASLGKVRVNNSTFLTNLETFYELKQSHKVFSIVVGQNGKIGCLVQPQQEDQTPIVLASGEFVPKTEIKASFINIDLIRDFFTHTWR
jgi:hypothetical protein